MKNFRADQGNGSEESVVQGGSAFHLPNFISPLSILSLLSVFSGILRPWRMIGGLPMRRGGIIGSFFAWGRLASIVLAVLIVFAPSLLQRSYPDWPSLALVCFGVSALSVLAAISRCCGSIASCAFWVVLTLFLGEKAFKPQLHNTFAFAAPVQRAASAARKYDPSWAEQLPAIEGEWEEMTTGVPISNQLITLARNESLSRFGQFRRAHQQAPNSSAESRVSSAADSVSSSFQSIIPTLPSAGSFISSPFSNSRGWQDGAPLPDSAYFGGAKVGAVASAMEGGGEGNGIDAVIGQVTSFFRQ